jgi:ABC-type oligopeptide transport system ATPase subunit
VTDAPPPPTSPPLLRVEHLRVTFPPRGHRPAFDALKGISFTLAPGASLGVVGESGSGKSTLARAILRLTPSSGRVVIDGLDWSAAPPGTLRHARSHAQMIFQDPAGSLNPRMRILDAVLEPVAFHKLFSSKAHNLAHAQRTLEACGLSAELSARYPHQLSGGQRQRAAIARAIAARPKLLMCDEPTSALDVSTQAQVLNLLQDLRRDLGLTLLFISHDLAVVEHVCDQVLVMHQGEVVEVGDCREVFARPAHPYTQSLLKAVPACHFYEDCPEVK